MGLLAERHDAIKVVVVDVCVDAEEALEDGLDDVGKVLGERDVDARREDRVVVKNVLDPREQVVDVERGRDLDGLLHRLAVGPHVLVLGAGVHDRARLVSAKLHDRREEQVDLVEEVDGCFGGYELVVGEKEGGRAQGQEDMTYC